LIIIGVSVILIDGSWLREGPGLSELVSRIKDLRGKKRGKTAIVIPTWRKNGLMGEHIKRLASQEHGGFDAIIVYSEEDEFLEDTCGIPSVHIKRKTDSGSAGGFYVGEKFALENGYQYIILSDNDCFPESKTLVQDLLRALEDGADVAFPKIRNADGKEPEANRLLPQYGCMRADVLRDVGLSYLPLHFGGEDVELFERMRKRGCRIAKIDSVAYHAQHAGVSPFACKESKMRYYLRSEILWRLLRYPFYNVCFNIFRNLSGGIFFAFSRKDLSTVMLDAAWLGSLAQFFKIDAAESPELMKAKEANGIDASRWSFDNGIQDGFINRMKRLCISTAGFLSQIPRLIGKDIIFDRTVGLSGIFLALFAKNSYLRENGGYYPVLKENRMLYLPLHLAMIALALCVSLPLAIVLTGMAYTKKSMLGINSDSYGL
jgi:GT2 family glycosyltransferase